jgi:S1/P1 Nuclease
MKKITVSLWSLIAILVSPTLLAWNAVGHELIAQVAYDHLTPPAKREVDYYTKVVDKRYPSDIRFLRASVWADYIKKQDVTAYNMWHYIDLPLSIDGIATQTPQTQNVVWAIYQCKQILASPRPNRFQKAEFLRFLTHFVGDVHQPLHAITRYSKEHLKGDQGGNLYRIMNEANKQRYSYAQNSGLRRGKAASHRTAPDGDADNTISLHTYWDNGAEFYPARLSYTEIKQLGQKIQHDYPESYFNHSITNDSNPNNWAKESYQIAKDFVYRAQEGKEIATSYQAEAQKIVEQRIAIAGYRLANMLNTLYEN